MGRPDMDMALRRTALADDDALDYIDSARGEFMGDGIARTAGGNPYDPMEGVPDPEDSFWESSKPLSEIRRYARSKGIRVNPWALLGAILCRIAVALPPNVVIDPLENMQPIPLNVFLALVGPSGSGKGITERAAATLVPDIRDAGTHLPASGEGIPTMYAYRESNDDGSRTLKSLSPRSLLSMPEITHLGGTAKRVGSTLISTLLSAYQGEPIGAANRIEANRYEIPRLGYRMGLITGVQPSNAGVILDNEASGFPQRFLWFDVRDPDTPLNAAPTPDVMSSLTCFPYPSDKLPRDPDTSVLEAYYNPKADGIHKPTEYTDSFIFASFPNETKTDCENDRFKTNKGLTGDPLDAHRMLTAARVAALLAFLDRPAGGLEVTDTEWRNAKTILDKSAEYRKACIEDMKKQRSQSMANEIEITVTAKNEVKRRGMEIAKEKILDYLSAINPGSEGVKGYRISQHVTRTYRSYTYEALEELHEEGHIDACGKVCEKASSNSWRLRR